MILIIPVRSCPKWNITYLRRARDAPERLKRQLFGNPKGVSESLGHTDKFQMWTRMILIIPVWSCPKWNCSCYMRQRGLKVDFLEIRKVFRNPWGMPRNSRRGPEWSWSFLSDPVQNGILPTWDAPETRQRGLNVNFLEIRKVFRNPWAILINSRCGPEWSWSFLSDPVQNGIVAVICAREA